MAQSKLQILIDVVTGGSEDKVKNLSGQFSDLAGMALKVTGGIAGVGKILQEAFEFGAEGAAISQTRESFDLLLQKVGAAPDLFDRLKVSADGTVSELKLMSSTSTLLAGAQGDLATSLANATPKLLEIARAAQKLNPTLGDTTFLYDSLATGIKRASPLILDNLGLTISVGQANEKYAEALGKTVEQLTAEEQKMALLNATLSAGDVLIEQVGGNVDSQTDAFKRLDVATEELANRVKEALAPTLADAAENALSLADQLGEMDRAMQKAHDEIVLGTADYDRYVEKVIALPLSMSIMTEEQFRAARAAGELDLAIRANTIGIDGWLTAIRNSTPAMDGWRTAMEKSKQPALDLLAPVAELDRHTARFADQTNQATIALIGLTEAELGRQMLADINKEYEDREGNLPGYSDAVNTIMVEMLGMSPAAAQAQITIANVRQEFVDSNGPLDQYIGAMDAVLDRYQRISEFGTLTLPTIPEGAGYTYDPVGSSTMPIIPRPSAPVDTGTFTGRRD